MDWLELRETPWGEAAYVLVGALSHSGRCRGVFCEGQTVAHLIEALDGVLRRLGGTTGRWRTDRMAAVVYPGHGPVAAGVRCASRSTTASSVVGVSRAAPAAQRCRRGRRSNYLTRSWWRSPPVATPAQAQDEPGPLVRRRRPIERRRGAGTIAKLAASERAAGVAGVGVPGASIRPSGSSSRSRWSRSRATATACRPAGAAPDRDGPRAAWRDAPEIYSSGPAGGSPGTAAPRGAAQVVRSPDHARLLERAVLDAFTTRKACQRKPNRPPGDRALAEAARLRGQNPGGVVVDLDQYAQIARVAGGRSEQARQLSGPP